MEIEECKKKETRRKKQEERNKKKEMRRKKQEERNLKRENEKRKWKLEKNERRILWYLIWSWLFVEWYLAWSFFSVWVKEVIALWLLSLSFVLYFLGIIISLTIYRGSVTRCQTNRGADTLCRSDTLANFNNNPLQNYSLHILVTWFIILCALFFICHLILHPWPDLVSLRLGICGKLLTNYMQFGKESRSTY